MKRKGRSLLEAILSRGIELRGWQFLLDEERAALDEVAEAYERDRSASADDPDGNNLYEGCLCGEISPCDKPCLTCEARLASWDELVAERDAMRERLAKLEAERRPRIQRKLARLRQSRAKVANRLDKMDNRSYRANDERALAEIDAKIAALVADKVDDSISKERLAWMGLVSAWSLFHEEPEKYRTHVDISLQHLRTFGVPEYFIKMMTPYPPKHEPKNDDACFACGKPCGNSCPAMG